MVFDAVGWTGLMCVIIAGWTTANPTIYRAGLAFQSLVPKMARSTGTIAAGVVCTIAGLFPAFAMQLLNFVGLYGTTLAPVGAVILVDYYVARRVGVEPNWAEHHGRSFNIAVLLAWVLPLIVFYYLNFKVGIFASYLTLPVYVATGVIYLVLMKLLNSKPAVTTA
jgi:NCS1 family nucleobase:cation symporter-1